MMAMDAEKGVLRWGGLAGILGSIIFIAVFVVVTVPRGTGPCPTRGGDHEVPRYKSGAYGRG